MSAGTGTPEGAGRGVGAGAVASLSGVGVLVVFVLQNTQSVEVTFLAWTGSWPLWLYTVVVAVLGAVVWVGLGILRRRRRRVERRARRRG